MDPLASALTTSDSVDYDNRHIGLSPSALASAVSVREIDGRLPPIRATSVTKDRMRDRRRDFPVDLAVDGTCVSRTEARPQLVISSVMVAANCYFVDVSCFRCFSRRPDRP